MAVMFTGIIEHLGQITAIEHAPSGSVLSIGLGPLVEGTKLGDSIAVNGICLTVTRMDGDVARFDASSETRSKTTLSSWHSGLKVNLERALTFGQRLGGHLVSGHVDGVGRLVERYKEGECERFTFVLPDDFCCNPAIRNVLGSIVLRSRSHVFGYGASSSQLDPPSAGRGRRPLLPRMLSLALRSAGR